MDRDLTQTDIAAMDPHLCWSRGPEGVCGGGAVHVEGVRAQAGAGPALLAPAPRPLPLQVQTSREHRLGPLLLAHLRYIGRVKLVTNSAAAADDPPVSQSVFTIMEKALLWPSPKAPTSAFSFLI